MGKMKELMFEVEQMLLDGSYPVDIAKRTGQPIELILQVEEDLYASEQRNIGVDYDQE